jgi:cell division inhibitor SepF
MSNPLKKTMVYLGLADEELDYDEPTNEQKPVNDAPRQQHNQASEVKAPVTPLRKAPAPVRQPAPAELNEILTVHPKQYKDAQVIAESFRDGVPVIINLSQMSDADARRLIDFASGLSQGLYGKIERVTNKVFLLSPSHVSVSGDQDVQATETEATFFAQR